MVDNLRLLSRFLIMSGFIVDATFEKSLGGKVVIKRFLSGNSLSREGHASEGRQFFFTVRLETSLTQYLNVSFIENGLGGFSK